MLQKIIDVMNKRKARLGLVFGISEYIFDDVAQEILALKYQIAREVDKEYAKYCLSQKGETPMVKTDWLDQQGAE